MWVLPTQRVTARTAGLGQGSPKPRRRWTAQSGGSAQPDRQYRQSDRVRVRDRKQPLTPCFVFFQECDGVEVSYRNRSSVPQRKCGFKVEADLIRISKSFYQMTS